MKQAYFILKKETFIFSICPSVLMKAASCQKATDRFNSYLNNKTTIKECNQRKIMNEMIERLLLTDLLILIIVYFIFCPYFEYEMTAEMTGR